MFHRRPFSPAALNLTILKGIGYIAAVLLFVSPLARWEGSLAGVIAVPLAIVLCGLADRYRVRSTVSAAATLLVVAMGLSANRIVGATVWLPRWLGMQSVLSIGGTMTFGLLVLAAVFTLRTLAARRPALALLEPASVMAVVVSLFAAHRDSNISQPRFFADW